MFNLGRLDNLADALGLEFSLLNEVLDDFDVKPSRLYRELTLWPANPGKKPRDVLCLKSRWRLVQERIYHKLLLPWFRPSSVSHGGVCGRSPATNARAHLGNTHVFLTDISTFYPSISRERVNRLFLRWACKPKVAGMLTRLCTHDHHLALGLTTSPIIANEIMKPVDRQIKHACKDRELTYTRFVDDIAISGAYDFESGGIVEIVQDILTRYHFRTSKSKTCYGRLDRPEKREPERRDLERLSITGIRLKRNHLDPSPEFVQELDRIIADHESLSKDGPFIGPLYTDSEVVGKAHYVCSLNAGRRRVLLGRIKQINWWEVMHHAGQRKLVRFHSRLAPRGEPRPDCSLPVGLTAGAENVANYYKSHDVDLKAAPF